MNDSAKTGLEREINRKLDALRDTSLAIMQALKDTLLITMGGERHAGAVGLRDEMTAMGAKLQKAWKEEEEEVSP